MLDGAKGVFVVQPTLSRLPVSSIELDILFEQNGVRVSSDTVRLVVKPAVTVLTASPTAQIKTGG